MMHDGVNPRPLMMDGGINPLADEEAQEYTSLGRRSKKGGSVCVSYDVYHGLHIHII